MGMHTNSHVIVWCFVAQEGDTVGLGSMMQLQVFCIVVHA